MNLNSRLPLSITDTDKDVKPYPYFQNLLTSLTQYLEPSGMSRNLQRDVNEANYSLKQRKLMWLQQHILYHDLRELMHDDDIVHRSQNAASDEVTGLVQEYLSMAEVEDYLHFSPHLDSTATLLGLDADEIYRMHPRKQPVAGLQQHLIPELEARLRIKCEHLIRMYQPRHESATGSPVVIGKSYRLPSILSQDIQCIELENCELEKDLASRDQQFWLYYKVLWDSLAALETLISHYCLVPQKHKDDLTANWLILRCDALHLKIQQTELEMLTETYHSDSIRALHIIKAHLDTAIEENDKEVAHMSYALAAYDGAGEAFDKLVKEYAALRDEVENKTWSLDKLKTSLNT